MQRRFLRLDLSISGLLALVGLGLALWLLTLLWPLVLLLLVAAMLAAALAPAVDWLVRHRLSRAMAVIILVLLVVLALASLALLIGPSFARQGQALLHRLPELRLDLIQFLDQHGAHDVVERVAALDLSWLQEPARFLSAGRLLLNGVTASVTVFVLTAYLLVDAPRILEFFDFAVPERYHSHLHLLLRSLREVVGGYIRGQLLTSLAAMIFAFAVFTALHLPDALALSVFGGVMDVVPIVGIYFFVVPSVAVGLSQSVPTGIAVAVLLLAYQEFENRVLVQRIYGNTLRLPSIVVVIALLAGAELQGIVGALLALPAAAAIRVCVEHAVCLRRRRLSPPAAVQPSEDRR